MMNWTTSYNLKGISPKRNRRHGTIAVMQPLVTHIRVRRTAPNTLCVIASWMRSSLTVRQDFGTIQVWADAIGRMRRNVTHID